MKKLAIIALIALGACQQQNVQVMVNDNVQAEIDGQLYTYNGFNSSYTLNGTYSLQSNNVSETQAITIQVSGVSEQTYQLTQSVSAPTTVSLTLKGQGSAPDTVLYSQFSPNPGTIEITNFDQTNKTISGTFQTEVHSPIYNVTRTITNGEFTVNYVEL